MVLKNKKMTGQVESNLKKRNFQSDQLMILIEYRNELFK